MTGYYVFSAAALTDAVKVDATDWQAAVRTAAGQMGANGKLACVAVASVQVANVTTTPVSTVNVTPVA